MPSTESELGAARECLPRYAVELGVDLCFQSLTPNWPACPGDYAEPRGTLLLALVEAGWPGCCALRPLDTADYASAGEMKRLLSAGLFAASGRRQLAEAVL